MELYAKGKNIPTHPIGRLFIQGEKFGDTVKINLSRIYEGIDLAGFSFVVHGITSEGWEAVQALVVIVRNDKIVLDWDVSPDFTLNSGKLDLELRASGTYNGVERILKFNMPSVEVIPTVNGRNGPLPETGEQLISQINGAAAAGLQEIQSEIEAFDLESVEERLDNIEADTAIYLARPEVIPVTQAEYDQSVHKQNALYVIVEEDEE
ncbi:MAG: hypothetical protein K6G20_04445 [Ruminococcus sp.]|nr:hypothetical protein [Ruminococcus sp.]